MLRRKGLTLSIIMPAYNEETTVVEVARKVLRTKIGPVKKELIIINDGSSDGTAKNLLAVKDRRLKLINKRVNQGKGAAIRRGLKEASGDILIIQDADLEYEPKEYVKLLAPILADKADVVYGSRFVTSEPRRILYFGHYLGNLFLTLTSNLFTNLNLSDMETCYKMFTRQVADGLVLKENRFGFEPEITAQFAQLKCRVYEVGISYSGRTYAEGKKISWKDGLWSLWCVLKYNLRLK